MKNERRSNLIHYVLPSIFSSVVFFLYTIFDGLFVGRGVGTDALGAVNLTMPFVMVVNAIFSMISVGGEAVAAVRLGRGDAKGTNSAFMHGFALTVLLSAALMLPGVGFTQPLARLLGANDTYLKMACEYIRCYSLFLVPMGLSTLLQCFCRNDGAPVFVSIVVAVSSVLDVFGNWLFVFPMQMGVKGAVLSTGLANVLIFVVLLGYIWAGKGQLRLRAVPFDSVVTKKIFVRGVPEMVSRFSTPISTLCMNYVILAQIGNTGINTYSIVNYVASFAVAVFDGVAVGLQPLFGQSYGAKKEEDLKYYYRFGMLISIVSSAAIYLYLCFFGSTICALYKASGDTYNMTLHALPRFAWQFCLTAPLSLITAYLYSTKRTREAAVINTLRGFILNIAAILILPILFGANMVWHAAGVAELVALIIAVVLVRHSERNGIVFK